MTQDTAKAGAFNTQFQIRTDDAWLDAVERWRRQNSTRKGGIPSRSDAIRTLVTRAIEAEELTDEQRRLA